MSGGLSLRLGIPREILSIPPGSRKGESNAGWLGTWDSPLRTDSASLKSVESFGQLTSFCSSWILAVSSWIVSWFSTHFLLENPSNVEPWNRFNSSISLRFFTCMGFTKFSILFQKWFMKKLLISSKLFVSCMSMINLTSLRLNNSIQFLDTSPIRFGLKLVFLNLGSKINENLLFFVKENPDCFVFPFRDMVNVCTN